MYQIVDQTADFIVVNKAPGISVHKDQAEAGLTMLLQQDLGLEQIYLVHRLDKVTSGVMVFATNAEVAAALSEQFSNREVSKFYLALSVLKPKRKQGLVCGDMQKSRRGSWKLSRSQHNPAVTQFISSSLKPGFRLFLIKPATGKTHQIRVALKSEGAPILGDTMYGGQQADRMYLHAYQLGFSVQGKHFRYTVLPDSGEHFNQLCKEKVQAAYDQPELIAWPHIPKFSKAKNHE
ncbi:MAG: TIGR01621 family pseudouridine synthase [Neptuniibacter caesariensis]|uniref:TIGR01621 family pseudouridine synthase n=1 Tax=Neptuniibacter caesariensis TaxID=207954 RepID=A0A2G6JLK3_NEPCE|nr:MAG: TIGR01621 family pseudouridine synthase [Neptuniibacter caesariensis]